MILNLTQHPATAEQLAAGVVDLPAEARQWLQQALTFECTPSRAVLKTRAEAIVAFAIEHGVKQHAYEDAFGFGQVMIGGAPFFMRALEDALAAEGLQALYAFSRRVSVEKVVDGVVVKTTEFRHENFVLA